MKLFYLACSVLVIFTFTSCIKDDFLEDFVEAAVRISNPIDTLELNTTYQLEAVYLNNVGLEEMAAIQWQSSNPEVINVDDTGLLTALQLGEATIIAEVEDNGTVFSDQFSVVVGESTVSIDRVVQGNIRTTSSYVLQGSFELSEIENGLRLTLGADYRASSSLPGLYVYLSNNRNSVSGAYEIGRVTTFNGSHEYTFEGVGINEYSYIVYYCKPFNVKVGEAEL